MQRVVHAILEGLADGAGSDCRRLFHGRGQCFEGLSHINVDWFDPVILITCYAEPDPAGLSQLVEALSSLREQTCALIQRRHLRGGPIETLWGAAPEQVLAREDGLNFALSLGAKQNVGFFLDMAPGRRWLRERSQQCNVLNLFSYTCSFSVAAVAGEARAVLNVDMSKAALEVGRENHRMNGQDQRLQRDVQFLPYDIFRSWKRIISKGPYDVVVIDPPSRQKGSFIADKDYIKVVKRLLSLMPAGGDVLACLNAPELGENFLIDLFAAHCPQAVLVQRLANRPDFPEMDKQRNLKMLHFRVPAA